MDTKAEVEEMTYPNVCFMVDNFNEVKYVCDNSDQTSHHFFLKLDFLE